jgi:glucose/arabinose dehydrogenase
MSAIVRVWPGLCAAALVFSSGAAAQAASVPVGFIDRQVASGLTSPTALAVAPDGRVFVTLQNGTVRIVQNDALVPAPFHTVDTDFSDERGLLGVVADPGFASNHWVYLYYTAKTPTTHNRIIRVTESNGTVVAGSTITIHDFPTVPAGTKWHMGGALRFGADGKLYVAVGNHEDNLSNPSHSQNLTTAFGKIHRFNSDGTVPTDNPFYGTAGAYRSIWSYGFRNPFTFAIQPGTGVGYINDVGQGTWEEVNRSERGGNYGWPFVEGTGANPAYLNPAYVYGRSLGCSVVGAAFYNPATAQFPASYVGKFLFADFCGGWIRTLDPATNATAVFVTGISYPVNLDVAPDGSLYYLARNQQTGNPTTGGGTVGRILYTGSQVPRITTQPQSQMVVVGEPAAFTVAAEGATGYQWQRNGADIAGATGTSYTIASTVAGDNGAGFRCVVSNSFGSVTSSQATLTATTNRRPTVTLTSPASPATYAPGQTIPFAATASDTEDGALGPAAFTWQIDFQHDAHAHPALPSTSGVSSGSFAVPAGSDHVSPNVWYRIYVAVRDSFGWVTTAFRDVRPRTQISDMAWVGTPANGWGPVERDMSNGEQAAGDGRTITLDGVAYGKGLGVHAPSDVRYNLNGTCTGHFVADVGIDDEANGGSVVFQVHLNGALAYDSGLVGVADLRKTIDLAVGGVNELRLVVTDGGNGNGLDHADWAGAHVTGCGGAATPTATATATPTTRATPTPTTRPTATPTAGSTFYRLVVRHSGKRADVAGASTADNAAVVQMAASGAASQDWQFTDMGGGYYRISNRNSGRCLDVSGASTADGAVVIQWACGTGANQQWQMVDLGTGYLHLVARHSAKCLDVPGASAADNVQLVQWTCGTGTNQDWQRVTGAVTPTATARATATATTRATPTATTRATATATTRPTPTTRPRPTPTAGTGCAIGATCEAETAALGGGVVASTLHAGYTGTGFADYQGSGTGSVEWTVNVPSAGPYTLNVRYANGGTGDRPMSIQVNGATVVSSLSFPVTGWTSWTVRTQSLSLPAGSVRIRATELPNGPNVDNLVVTSSGAAAWAANTTYAVGSLATYGGVTYRCIQAHTSQVGWEPPNAPSLWTPQ